MNDLSVRGVYRRYVVGPRIALLGTDDPAIVGDIKNISVAKDILGSGTGFVRPSLEPVAVRIVGPAQWHQDVCDNIRGAVNFIQTWTHIDVRIQLVPDAGVTASTLGSLQNTWQTGIEGTWNNPAQTLGSNPKPWTCARTLEVPCRVSVKVHWVTADPHHRVAVHAGMGATNESNWHTVDSGAVAAHEFGHMLGLPDEYADPVLCPDRSPVGTGTIMDNNSNFIPRRLLQWVADEIGSDLE